MPRCPTAAGSPGRRAGFTLAEVLAAMVFLAIVIPVAVEGLRVASQAGQVGLRKAVAARLADQVLNEWLVSNQGVAGLPSGEIREGVVDYRWSLRAATWPEDSMREVTVVMAYTVQGQDYEVRLSTLVGMTSP